MAQSYPKEVIGSEITSVTQATQTKIDTLVSLFAQLVIQAHS